MAENHVRNRDPQQYALSDHRTAGKRLKRINGAQMALAKKNSIIAEFFGSAGALVNLINVFDAAVKTVQAEFHEKTPVRAQRAAPDRFSGGM